MIASALRSSALSSRARALTRGGFNPSNDNYGHLPFSIKNKYAFGLKLSLYLGIGFGAPFFGAWFQLKKSGAI
ncbi:hypothetical protein H9P43_000771 [Blastocladiella emersonii ATCC 22665]|nr:hypothetical protein H9P43_000771 [Blastocladiella emersonii ATCC 22665]